MIIVEESRMRRQWPWILVAVFALFWLLDPTLPLFVVTVITGWIVWWVRGRQQRASISVDGADIVVANHFSTYRIPIAAASIEVRTERFRVATGDEELDTEINKMAGSALYVVSSDPEVGSVTVEAARGLLPAEFRRVTAELETVVAIGG